MNNPMIIVRSAPLGGPPAKIDTIAVGLRPGADRNDLSKGYFRFTLGGNPVLDLSGLIVPTQSSSAACFTNSPVSPGVDYPQWKNVRIADGPLVTDAWEWHGPDVVESILCQWSNVQSAHCGVWGRA